MLDDFLSFQLNLLSNKTHKLVQKESFQGKKLDL